MRNPGRVLVRDEISLAVWDRDAADAPNIVRVYVSYIRKKLSEIGVTDLLETVDDGYVLRSKPAT